MNITYLVKPLPHLGSMHLWNIFGSPDIFNPTSHFFILSQPSEFIALWYFLICIFIFKGYIFNPVFIKILNLVSTSYIIIVPWNILKNILKLNPILNWKKIYFTCIVKYNTKNTLHTYTKIILYKNHFYRELTIWFDKSII